MDLKTPLSGLSGIGPSLSKNLAKLELFTVEDLIFHYPFRYDDFSQSQSVSQAKVGETITFTGELWSIKNTYTRFRKVLTQAVLNDSTGTIEIIWFNQPWLIKNLKAGDRIQVSGKVNRKGSKINLVSPVWERVTPEVTQNTVHTGRLTPIYPETYGLTSKWLRFKISKLLPIIVPQIPDPIPSFLTENMFSLQKAILQIHFPDNFDQAKQAKKRLAFDELFYIQLASIKKRGEWKEKKLTNPLKINQKKLAVFIKNLPFELTKAQKKVVEEIVSDLKDNHPMNRLVQGDVGSGKTVVAAVAAFLAHLNGLKTIIMAPTEILAFQHYETLTRLLGPYNIEIGIYTGSRKFTKPNNVIASDSEAISKKIKIATSPSAPRNDEHNPPDIIVGTHAVLSKKLVLDNVGLIVVDEQQRFGVEQRGLLRNRSNSPHFLTMTATPIPRTVALTLYGDLDLSVINEMPKGRKIVRTHFVPAKKRADAYKFISEQVKLGFQIYIVTPLIEQSETNLSAKAAKVEFVRLKEKIFPQLRLGLLHGKLKSKEKESVINEFKDHKIDILISTSVVEVGVDVPNATIMVIEGAEKFGLAQLHQLRGRVGRGDAQSYTFLFAEQENSQSISRLKNLEKIYDGLKLSELDLKIRGSGEIFGTMQSGRWDLKIASLSDLELVEKTKSAASKILQMSPALDKYPQLRGKLSLLAEIMPD